MRMNAGALGGILPAWARPVARRFWIRLRAVLDWSGISALLERDYRRRLITHACPKGRPAARARCNPERKAESIDVQAAERLLKAWRAATRGEESGPAGSVDDVWDVFSRNYHGDLIEILGSAEAARLAGYLCNMSRHGATVGITQGSTEFRRAAVSRALRDWGALFTLDRLVSLAEAVGVLRAENPEQGRWGENIYTDVDELIRRLNQALGIDMIMPEVEGCLFGLETRSGTVHFRDITALYAAWRTRMITAGQADVSVCEIGGGVGRVAFYCHRFGIKSYAIYDLPLVNVLQGYFLIRALPGANVVLFGEDLPPGGDCVKVLPGRTLAEAPAGSFDVALNQDSFPEIDRAIVAGYLREITRTTGRYFLSINHEAETPVGSSAFRHLVVGDVAQEFGALRRLYRFPCLVRSGYVEELYGVSS